MLSTMLRGGLGRSLTTRRLASGGGHVRSIALQGSSSGLPWQNHNSQLSFVRHYSPMTMPRQIHVANDCHTVTSTSNFDSNKSLIAPRLSIPSCRVALSSSSLGRCSLTSHDLRGPLSPTSLSTGRAYSTQRQRGPGEQLLRYFAENNMPVILGFGAAAGIFVYVFPRFTLLIGGSFAIGTWWTLRKMRMRVRELEKMAQQGHLQGGAQGSSLFNINLSGLSAAFKYTQVYTLALKLATENQQVVATLGAPLTPLPSISSQERHESISGSGGRSQQRSVKEVVFPLQGSRASGEVHVKATADRGTREWEIDTLYVTVDNGTRIVVLDDENGPMGSKGPIIDVEGTTK